MEHKFICNTEHLINWDDLILNIEEEEVLPNLLARSNDDFDPTVSYHMQLKNANINWSNVKWTDYNLENTKTDVVDKFSKLVNSRMLRCFISKIDPGVCVPTHWDEGDVRFYDSANKENFSRYICFIQDPAPGHMMVVENHCFHFMPKGAVYKWSNYTDFHSAANTGFKSYYLFHFLGEDM
jgi:hypothetical protein